jgi:hypothetical protein
MMTPEAEAVTKLVERTKVRLDELLAEYVELYHQAYESESTSTGEQEIAKLTLIPIWNEIYRITFSNKTDD